MLHLVYSNRFEALAEALVEAIGDARREGRDDLYAGSPILVPNAQVATAVKLAMARRDGIAAGLSFPFVDGFFANCVAGSRTDLAVLDRSRLQLLVHGALADPDLLGEPELAPVRAYLDAAGDDAGARSLRRVQLSSQIAGLYADYALYRPELFAAWRAGRAVLRDGEHAATEAWQRRLWRALAGERGALGRIRDDTGVTWMLLPHIFEEVPAAELGVPASVYAIGFSHLSPGYQALFAKTAEVSELRLFALNPCMEFWEDVPSGWEIRRLSRRGEATAADDGDDPPALRLWGRPGRETIRMLDEISSCDFEARFSDPLAEPGARASALRALQRDILAREPERTAPIAGLSPDDESLRVLACPSPRRELEIIGGEIQALMGADTTLRYNDIAILIARSGEELYQAQIGSVFHELGDIPHHVTDRPLPVESRYAEALELLFDLPLGRFTRPELLRVLTHPAVLARDPEIDPGDWLRWIDALGVVHGADRGDHEGTYIDEDVFNWDQAIRRLGLGAVMTGARSGDDRAVALGGFRYAPEELAAGELESAARLAALARSLIADARYAREAIMPLAEWRAFFDALATSYLAPRTDADERHLEACRTALAGLEDMDLEGRPLDFRAARELARGALASLRVSRGELFADGVLVAPLSPMRPLPFRVVFVAGLGQGQFPSSQKESPIDLRAAARKPGDVSASERDRYTFLEALLSARDRLYVSYVARDEESGEELAPSTVVSELIEIAERGYRVVGAPPLEIRFPLRAFDPRCVPEPYAALGEDVPAPISRGPVSAAARSQAGARALRRHLDRARAGAGARIPAPDEIRTALATKGRAPLRERMRMLDLSAQPPREREGDRGEFPLPLSTLRRFLEAPIQAWAQAVLGLRDDDFDDPSALEDEPFAADPGARARLLRGSLALCLRDGRLDPEAVARAYEAESDAVRRTGRAPVGLFSEIEREQHVRVLSRWQEGLAEAFADAAPRAEPLFVGSAREHARSPRVVPPLVLEGVAAEEGARDAALHGTTNHVSETGDAIIVLDTGSRDSKRMLLRGLFDHAVLAAAGVGDGDPRLLVHVHANKTVPHSLEAFTAREARDYLRALAAELLGQSHAYLLPGDLAIAHLLKPKDRSLEEQIVSERDGGRFESGYEVVRRLHRFEPPEGAEALARRRLGPLLEKLEEA